MDCNPLEIHHPPWGTWEVLLDTSYCKVKRITVNSQQRLSYQKHFKREEQWTVVQGTATVTLNDNIHTIKTGSNIFIPKEAKHRVENKEKDQLIFIEIQQGTYFGEDDIIRIEDDYDRT